MLDSKKKVNALQSKIDQLNSHLETVKKEKLNEEQKNLKFRNSIDENNTKIELLKSKLAMANKEKEEIDAKNTRIDTEIKKVKKDNTDLRKIISDKEN